MVCTRAKGCLFLNSCKPNDTSEKKGGREMFGLPLDTAMFLWIIPVLLVIAQFVYCYWDDRKDNH